MGLAGGLMSGSTDAQSRRWVACNACMPLVLFVSYSGAIGGAERLLVDFATGVHGEVCIACPEGALAQAARTAGLRVFVLPRRSLRLRGGIGARTSAAIALLAHAFEARALARNLTPDVVIAWGMRTAIASLLFRRRSTPLVFQHNDLLPAGGVLRALIRVAAARADLVIALSHAIAHDLGRPAQVVHPGIEVDDFHTPPQRSQQVLVLGALVAWKRPDVALEAVALARQTLPGLKLRFVGAPMPEDGDTLAERLRERAARSDLAGAVEFAGAVSDPRSELAHAGCLLHCAEREPFGMVVLEALAAGLPVVAPASGSPAEIADTSCAVLYPPGDAAAAGAGIAQVLSDPDLAAGLGVAGRKHAREGFTRAAARMRYRCAIEALLPERAPFKPRESAARLAIVTVTHNSARELDWLLSSVSRHLPAARVVIVDCASSDDSVAIAQAWNGRCSIVQTDNVGFGRACNLGLREVREPAVALLNPDVELLDDSLARVADKALVDDRLLAPLVLTPSGGREDSVHPLPGSLPDLLNALVPHDVAPRQLVPWHATEPQRVGWAVGCAVVARTETLRRLGPFDERIFLYGEDLDLSLRAADAKEAFGGEAFDRLAQARREVVVRRQGQRRAALDDFAQALTFRSRLLAKRALGREVERERRQLEALRRTRVDGSRAERGGGPR
jgi:N-acetylglucosaminyl-diphospho-decaprenol L-rhamnosyltransferase